MHRADTRHTLPATDPFPATSHPQRIHTRTHSRTHSHVLHWSHCMTHNHLLHKHTTVLLCTRRHKQHQAVHNTMSSAKHSPSNRSSARGGSSRSSAGGDTPASTSLVLMVKSIRTFVCLFVCFDNSCASHHVANPQVRYRTVGLCAFLPLVWVPCRVPVAWAAVGKSAATAQLLNITVHSFSSQHMKPSFSQFGDAEALLVRPSP
jgi:hypothetical protein